MILSSALFGNLNTSMVSVIVRSILEDIFGAIFVFTKIAVTVPKELLYFFWNSWVLVNFVLIFSLFFFTFSFAPLSSYRRHIDDDVM